MKKWKRGLSIVLALAMVLGLSACGLFGKKNDHSGQNENNVNSELAKQYVYRMQEFDFSDIQKQGTDSYVQSIVESNGTIYIVMVSYDYNGNGDRQQYRVVSMKPDGSGTKFIQLKTTLDGEKSGEDSQPESEAAESDTAESDAEETGGEEDELVDVDYNYYVYESNDLNNFQIDGERIWGFKNYYYDDYSDPDNYISERENYICSWDFEGNMLWESPLEFPEVEGAWYSAVSVIGLGNGTAVILVNGNENGRTIASKITVDGEGNLSEMQPVDGLEKLMEKYSSIAPMPDGRLMVTYYGEDWSKLYAATYDFKKDFVGESFPIPTTVANNMGRISVDSDGDLFYANNLGVFKYHIGDEEGVQVMSFVNSDLDISYLSAVLPLDKEHFVALYSEYDQQSWNNMVKGGIFTRVPPEEIPDKTVLILAGNYIGSDIRSRVIKYNKTSSTHRIVLKDYSQYAQADDYLAGITQMNNDIISGNMPDILVVENNNMNLATYISKGLLADIGELIEQDEELSQEEFMENVFEACSVNGKLYEVIPCFNVRTYIGKKSIIGNPANWTMEEARRCVASMPDGASMFGDMTRPYFFQTVMSMCGSDFIDVSTGKCNFDSPEFIALMEYAKELPEELGEDYYEGDWYTAYQSQYRENRTLLSYCYISGLENLVYTINGSFGEDVSFVGFPNEGGQGAMVNVYTSYALAAKGTDLEEAWSFVRYYLTDEYQETLQWDLPIDKKYLDKIAEKATKKPTYEDGDGNTVEDEYSWWINDEQIILDPLTAGQVEEIKAYIASITTRSYYNENIDNIISEEMDAFYQGQKSAKDVAAIIQSRAQIYVNENR